MLIIPTFWEITSNCLGCKNEVIQSQKETVLLGVACLQKRANSMLGGVCRELGRAEGSEVQGSRRLEDTQCSNRVPGWPGEHLLFLGLMTAGSSRTVHMPAQRSPLFIVNI